MIAQLLFRPVRMWAAHLLALGCISQREEDTLHMCIVTLDVGTIARICCDWQYKFPDEYLAYTAKMRILEGVR